MSVLTVVAPEVTRCTGPAALPLLFWPTTCTNGRLEKMRRGGGGAKGTQWMHPNSEVVSMS